MSGAGKVRPLRDQRLYAIQRNDLWWTGGSGWAPDIYLARIYPERQARRTATLDVGLPCELVEVCPQQIKGRQRIRIGGDA